MVVILAGSIDGETTINYIVCALIVKQCIYLVWLLDYDFQRQNNRFLVYGISME